MMSPRQMEEFMLYFVSNREPLDVHGERDSIKTEFQNEPPLATWESSLEARRPGDRNKGVGGMTA